MSSEGNTTGGERAVVPSAEEAPFSAEQLAWIDCLIAARHTAPPRSMDLPLVPVASTADGPLPRPSSSSCPGEHPPLLLLANGCNQLVGTGAHGPLACPPHLSDMCRGPGCPHLPTHQPSNPWIMATSLGWPRGISVQARIRHGTVPCRTIPG